MRSVSVATHTLLFLMFAAGAVSCHIFILLLLATDVSIRSCYDLAEFLLNPGKSWLDHLLNIVALLLTAASLHCVSTAVNEKVEFKPLKMFTIAMLVTIFINILIGLMVKGC